LSDFYVKAFFSIFSLNQTFILSKNYSIENCEQQDNPLQCGTAIHRGLTNQESPVFLIEGKGSADEASASLTRANPNVSYNSYYQEIIIKPNINNPTEEADINAKATTQHTDSKTTNTIKAKIISIKTITLNNKILAQATDIVAPTPLQSLIIQQQQQQQLIENIKNITILSDEIKTTSSDQEINITLPNNNYTAVVTVSFSKKQITFCTQSPQTINILGPDCNGLINLTIKDFNNSSLYESVTPCVNFLLFKQLIDCSTQIPNTVKPIVIINLPTPNGCTTTA